MHFPGINSCNAIQSLQINKTNTAAVLEELSVCVPRHFIAVIEMFQSGDFCKPKVLKNNRIVRYFLLSLQF